MAITGFTSWGLVVLLLIVTLGDDICRTGCDTRILEQPFTNTSTPPEDVGALLQSRMITLADELSMPGMVKPTGAPSPMMVGSQMVNLSPSMSI